MEALECMLTRKSVKKYKSDPVPKELLEKIIQAGLNAPSGLNKQAAVILAVTDRQVRDELSKLNAGKDPFFRADPFYGAPVVLVVLADKSVPTYLYDGSLVMENLQLAAHALGLGACWIHTAKQVSETEAGKKILEVANINGEYEGIGFCVLGIPDDIPQKELQRKSNYVYYLK